MNEINLQSMQTAKNIAPSQKVEVKSNTPRDAVLTDVRQADMQQAIEHELRINKDGIIIKTK